MQREQHSCAQVSQDDTAATFQPSDKGMLSPGSISSRAAIGRFDPIDVRARAYADASRSANTRRAYRSDWNDFAAWCAAQGEVPLPATSVTVVRYLTDSAHRVRPQTLARRLCAIRFAHETAQLISPTATADVRLVLAGISRREGRSSVPRAALVLDDLRSMLVALPEGALRAHRDRALLLLGFAAALRRSELAALDVADLEAVSEGLRVTIRRSK